jgi:hypothetical protein
MFAVVGTSQPGIQTFCQDVIKNFEGRSLGESEYLSHGPIQRQEPLFLFSVVN